MQLEVRRSVHEDHGGATAVADLYYTGQTDTYQMILLSES